MGDVSLLGPEGREGLFLCQAFSAKPRRPDLSRKHTSGPQTKQPSISKNLCRTLSFLGQGLDPVLKTFSSEVPLKYLNTQKP